MPNDDAPINITSIDVRIEPTTGRLRLKAHPDPDQLRKQDARINPCRRDDTLPV